MIIPFKIWPCQKVAAAIVGCTITTVAWSQELPDAPSDNIANHCAGLVRMEYTPDPKALASLPQEDARKHILRHTMQLVEMGALTDASSCFLSAIDARDVNGPRE